jgi:hypothetical protein
VATGEGERGVTDGGTAPPQQDGFVLQQEQYHGHSRRRWFRCVLFHFLAVVKEDGNRLFHFYNGGQRSRFGHFAIAAFSKFFPPRKEGINMLLLVWMAD